MKISLLTLVMISCFMLFSLKIADIIHRDQDLSEALFIEASYAQKAEEEGGEEGDGAAEGEQAGSEGAPENDEDAAPKFTQIELDILQRLSIRRQDLEKWQRDLEIKENVLNITQSKIDQKIKELKDLKEIVEKSLAQYNKKEDAKTRSLVKIYESMKPQDAAKIFAELDMDTLLLVVNKMKEKKVALILGKMEAKLAKDLTIRFAERGSIKNN